jgi:hypothetical protein
MADLVRIGPDATTMLSCGRTRDRWTSPGDRCRFVYVAPVGDPELERWVEAGTTFAASQLPRKCR